jgi:hypothetical protein
MDAREFVQSGATPLSASAAAAVAFTRLQIRMDGIHLASGT